MKGRNNFDETEYFFNLLLQVSQILYIRKIQIGKNNWASETWQEKLEKYVAMKAIFHTPTYHKV